MAQAARDYLYILRLLKYHPEDSAAKRKAREYEEFFYSDWYSTLTDVDHKYLIRRLIKSVGMTAKRGGTDDSEGISESGVLAEPAD